MNGESLSLKEELILFSIAHSHCFVDFAGLEAILADMLAKANHVESQVEIRTAFYGIESFRSKLEFVDRFLQIKYRDDETMLAAWATARKLSDGAAQRRNELAHWEQLVYSSAEAGRRVVMLPPAMNPQNPKWEMKKKAKMGEPPAYAIGVCRVHEILYQIAGARMHLLHVLMRVAKAKNGKISAPEQLQAPTLTEIVKDFRKQLSRISSD